MRGPTAALLWEIWGQHRATLGIVGGLTAAGRLIEFAETNGSAGAADRPVLTTLFGMLAFVLLLTVFNHTESNDGRGVGRFPRRLFTLPVSSLRLVAVPVLAGIAGIELLYLLWMQPYTLAAASGHLFTSVLCAAFIVFYLAVLWTFERTGPVRLIVIGVIATAMFVIGLLPTFAPSPPPLWRSEAFLSAMVGIVAASAFALAWRHVAGLRAGETRSPQQLESLARAMADLSPARQKPFATAAAAQFWFEWRRSGQVLPALVAGVIIVLLAPMSWLWSGDGDDTLNLLIGALATPVILAIPVGAAFSRPTMWSEDFGVHPFVAVRPLREDELVATKVKVAVVSVVSAWLLLLSFVVVWLSLWGNLDSLSRLALQIWAFHEGSRAAVFAAAAVVAAAGTVLTWRFMVVRLWTGLSGRRLLVRGSILSLGVAVIAYPVLDVGRFPGWLLDDPARLTPVVWIGASLVIAKYWLAAYAWRGVSRRHIRAYLVLWLGATTALLTLGLLLWGMLRIYLPVDVDRLLSIIILMALLAVPLARIGLAPAALARNRHR
jgi:hypothetical protein